METLVALHDVEQGYGREPVVKNVSMALGAGAHGLLGPNGAGKTTLIRTLCTAIPPRAGTVELIGHPVDAERDAQRARREIGYLGQNFGYELRFSALDFVLYCLWLRGEARPQAQEGYRALALTGMDAEAHRKLKNLSGGMKQRVGIAAALAGSPRIVLLDEPTVGLDPAQRLQFRRLVAGLANSTCVVLSTHLIEDVAAACDTVVVMQEGRIKFTGTAAELERRAEPHLPGDTDVERGYMSVLDSGGAW